MPGKRAFLLVTAALASVLSLAQGAEPVRASGRKLALLVGCSAYSHLDVPTLAGAANDVTLMRRLLVERFGFDEADITVLSEAAGHPRPTRANIEQQFARLAQQADADGQVFILMSGHGTQIPAKDPTGSDDFEPDGLDEVFLCADARPFDDQQQAMPGSIVDRELGAWVRKIRDRGAHVWIVVDCCHSGTILRGADDETVRRVPADRVVPAAALEAARKRARQAAPSTRGASETNGDLAQGADLLGIAALYASQPEQSTIELPLPPGSDTPTTYGLLTYTINEVLMQSREPLTYRELVQRVAAAYLRGGRTSPTPFLEGAERDREILGQRTWPDRSAIRIASPSRINAGSLQGLTRGTILKVFDSQSRAGSPALGYAEITRLGSLDAEIARIAYGGVAAPQALPEGARCEVEQVDYGTAKLKVAVDVAAAPLRDAVLAALGDLADESKLVERAEGHAADWVVRGDGAELFVEPATGIEALDPAATPRFGPLPQGAKLKDYLAEHLTQLARGRNLLALARPDATTRSADAKGACRVRFELVRLADLDDKQGTPIDWEAGGRMLRPGELIGCRLENLGQTPADVTLLFVDSGYGISALFPPPGVQTDNRLYPGDKPFVAFRARVQADTVGLEHLVLIAVPGEGPPVDFSLLEQPTLPRSRGARHRGLDSPLGRLLQSALYGQTRGGTGSRGGEQLDFVSWRVADE